MTPTPAPVLPANWASFRVPNRQEWDLRGENPYKPGLFHPVYIGEIYDARYVVLRKLGFGMFSTVWLVRDIVEKRYRAMKVLSAECYGRGPGKDIFERDILMHLQNADPQHPGFPYISRLVDCFSEKGPCGIHAVFIFDIMVETLGSFAEEFEYCRLPPPLLKRFVKQLLLALDYAHKSGVIHTGLYLLFRKTPRDILIKKYRY